MRYHIYAHPVGAKSSDNDTLIAATSYWSLAQSIVTHYNEVLKIYTLRIVDTNKIDS